MADQGGEFVADQEVRDNGNESSNVGVRPVPDHAPGYAYISRQTLQELRDATARGLQDPRFDAMCETYKLLGGPNGHSRSPREFEYLALTAILEGVADPKVVQGAARWVLTQCGYGPYELAHPENLMRKLDKLNEKRAK